MSILFKEWLNKTKELQQNVYGVDYSVFHSDSPDDIRSLIEYLRWNMLAIDDELAEVRKAISWKPWQHDKPYADRHEIIKECVDVLHFVANILCAAGATDAELDREYVSKMELNAKRQRIGYKVLSSNTKCKLCSRALDDYDVSVCREQECPSRNL